ncbi:MAG: hypothetical protein ACRENU_07020, partial [Gemmatimonadaceae bacterium]
AFPTLEELEAVENYVYAARAASLRSLRRIAGDAPMAVVVFAHEYRSGSRTAHRRHADLTLSRTGLARIGTAPPRYVPQLRGFTPEVSGRPDKVRVSPAKYAAFIAVRLEGSREAGRPMRFQDGDHHEGTVADDHREFWMPLHKLFSGRECLSDYPNLTVELSAHHVNEKIRRIHTALARHTVEGKKFDTGWDEPDISNPPFRFSAKIATLNPGGGDPPGLLVPVPHRGLAEPAVYRRKPLGFNVPPHGGFVGSLDIAAHYNSEGLEVRNAPAYVHARTQMTDKGEVDLNKFSNVADIVNRGGYKARHYLDYTGDGWVAAEVKWGEGTKEPKLDASLPAFSLVTAPDFFLACDQAELSEWADTLPPEVRARVWYMAPSPLCDQRLPANLQLPETPFKVDDTTITAVVSATTPAVAAPSLLTSVAATLRSPHPCHTSLPDDAAGIMAPGWDVARDWLPDHTQHLATYGLGSPFPEDTKLCAALSAFWPAVAPDATRQFAWTESRSYRTITPLTDEEIGLGKSPSWDDVPPPRVVRKHGQEHIIYPSLQHTDYVRSAVANRLTISLTGRVTQRDYTDRTMAMTMAYRALGPSHFRWVVLSYRQLPPEDRDRRRAERATGLQLEGTAHRFDFCYPGAITTESKAPFSQRILIRRRATVMVDPSSSVVLIGRSGTWARKSVTWK